MYLILSRRLGYFQLEDVAVTQAALTDRIIKHYVQQAALQIYRVLLGLEVLGNPVGFVMGLKDGAIGLFYHPIQVGLPFSFSPLTLIFSSNISCLPPFPSSPPSLPLSPLTLPPPPSPPPPPPPFPPQGAVLGPGEFFEGLALGGRQFVGGTLGLPPPEKKAMF